MEHSPVSDNQTAQWLTVWNTANASSFMARGLNPLPVESVLAYAELACQPLLIGRFFFVHEAQATRDSTRLKTYEFLHTTLVEHVLRQLATDCHRLPASWLGDVIEQIREAGKSADDEGPDLVRMMDEILPELVAEDPPRPL